MKNYSCIFFLIVSTYLNAQTKESSYFRFYKDGEKYLKLVKYVYFDSTVSNNQKINGEQIIYFNIDGQRFIYKNNNKIDTCSINFFKKIKLSRPSRLQQETYEYFKNKKKEQEKKMNNKIHLVFPVKGFENYTKVYVLEKIKNDKLIRYEVDWEYSTF